MFYSWVSAWLIPSEAAGSEDPEGVRLRFWAVWIFVSILDAAGSVERVLAVYPLVVQFLFLEPRVRGFAAELQTMIVYLLWTSECSHEV